MKPPKCKSCGVSEWQHVCRPVIEVFREAAGLPVKPVGGYKKPTAKQVRALAAALCTPENRVVEAWPTKAAFDRKAYQREYMRGWRAKKRGGK